MKRKFISAAVLAAFLLSGCSEEGGISGALSSDETSVGVSAQSTQSSQSSSSSKGGAPAVIAPNFNGSSWQTSEESEPSISSEPIEPSKPGEESEVTSEPSRPENPSSLVNSAPSDAVEYVDTLSIENGTAAIEEKTVLNADLNIGQGCMLTVSDGFYVNGTITLEEDAEIYIENGGELIMCGESVIDGSGNIVVTENFNQINCGMGTIKAHIVPPERKVVDGVTTVGGVVIANKAIKLPPEYGSHLSLDEVEPEVYEALTEMNSDSEHRYVNKSGYRSYWDQQAIFENYCNMYGYEEADTFSSHAGHSEHQTGYTMDLDSFSESYGATPEGIWLAENCWRYGFIIRYPKGKEEITGYTYEPWHVRWLGTSTAKLVYDSGLTLEEFLNVEGGWTVID